MTMIEKMARAAYEANPIIRNLRWEDILPERRKPFLDAQRAALAAAREPTEAMLIAAAGPTKATAIGEPEEPPKSLLEKWEIMIDAALAETAG